MSRLGAWLSRTFGAEPTPESPHDRIPVRESLSIGEAQVVAAKLHANGVAVWLSTTSLRAGVPIQWPTLIEPVPWERMGGLAQASVLVLRKDVPMAQALLAEPSPFDDDLDQVP